MQTNDTLARAGATLDHHRTILVAADDCKLLRLDCADDLAHRTVPRTVKLAEQCIGYRGPSGRINDGAGRLTNDLVDDLCQSTVLFHKNAFEFEARWRFWRGFVVGRRRRGMPATLRFLLLS